MIRKGLSGQATSDGMTDDIAQHLKSQGNQIVPDKAALDWYYYGGDRL